MSDESVVWTSEELYEWSGGDPDVARDLIEATTSKSRPTSMCECSCGCNNRAQSCGLCPRCDDSRHSGMGDDSDEDHEEHMILGHNEIEVEDHDEKDCPTDDDSYGPIGWAGDRDVSYGEYTASVPYHCECECHSRPGGIWAG